MRVLSLLALFALAAFAMAELETVQFYSGLTHDDATRRIVDLRSHVEEVMVNVKVRNSGKDATSFYLVAVSADVAPQLAFVQAATAGGAGKGAELKTTAVNVAGLDSAPKGTEFFKAELASPLKPGESVALQLVLAFTHRLVPYPKEITQDQAQLVQYSGNAYFYSPYPTAKQSTTVRLGSKNVGEYTKATATQKDDTLESGPFADVKPFSASALQVHFENNSPFVTFRKLVREIEISHRGNIAVEEHVLLQHTGAALKGNTFSRYDYQRQGARGAGFRQITAALPLAASDIYYRDQIGNISTSAVRADEHAGHTVFEVQPRFPMFGGWKTDFYFGYNLPAYEQLLVEYETGRYVLNTTFGSPFPEAAIDELEVRVILPEHVTDVEFATPFDIDAVATDTRVTYLDISGRHVLVLRKRNACRLHNQHFQVAYHFAAVNMYQEPLLLVAGFATFFLAAMFYVRLELSISPKTGKARVSVRRAGPVGELIARALAAHAALVAAADNARSGKGASERIEKAFVEADAITEQLAKEGDAAVSGVAARLSAAGNNLRAAAKKYAKAEGKGLDAARSAFAQRLEEAQAVASELAAI